MTTPATAAADAAPTEALRPVAPVARPPTFPALVKARLPTLLPTPRRPSSPPEYRRADCRACFGQSRLSTLGGCFCSGHDAPAEHVKGVCLAVQRVQECFCVVRLLADLFRPGFDVSEI